MNPPARSSVTVTVKAGVHEHPVAVESIDIGNEQRHLLGAGRALQRRKLQRQTVDVVKPVSHVRRRKFFFCNRCAVPFGAENGCTSYERSMSL